MINTFMYITKNELINGEKMIKLSFMKDYNTDWEKWIKIILLKCCSQNNLPFLLG